MRSRLADPLKQEILRRAEKDRLAEPVTVTAFIAERSKGSLHDFYSEGDYWWPDSLHPDGPYVRRDGETNPNNFVAHRHVLIRLSQIVGNLTSAYLLTGERRYAEPVARHLMAWFVDEKTRMNPHLLYAQAIRGVATGRGIGIIDTVHLVEVAQAILRLEEKGVLPPEVVQGTRQWFAAYLKWLTTHPYGISEMNTENNHATCWAMQAAMFAKLVGDKEVMRLCADRFKQVLLPQQMAADGSFPSNEEVIRNLPIRNPAIWLCR